MEFDYKNVLIMGYGKSGKAVENVLKKLEIDYKIFDKKFTVNGGLYLNKLSKKKILLFDLIVVSPGISNFDKYLLLARKMSIKVISELEFGYWFCDSKLIAVTGTNGKTTTTKLINDILLKKYNCDMFGNIGEPLSLSVFNEFDYISLEVSSFQLENIDCFNPYISIILNIDKDHLDRHKTLENYINCKFNILKNVKRNSLVILNADDEIIMDRDYNISADKYYISKGKEVRGVYIKNNKIYSNIQGEELLFCDLSVLNKFIGFIDDILVGILVGLLLNIDKDSILDGVLNFKLYPHRFQILDNKNNIRFIDDSKSTNIHSVKNALKMIENNVILLMGGEDKKLDFDDIFKIYRNKLNFVIAFGKTRNLIYKTALKHNYNNIKVFKNFYDAVKFACSYAKGGDSVLLSPGCSSFDEFSSYSERGDKFIEIVYNYFLKV